MWTILKAQYDSTATERTAHGYDLVHFLKELATTFRAHEESMARGKTIAVLDPSS